MMRTISTKHEKKKKTYPAWHDHSICEDSRVSHPYQLLLHRLISSAFRNRGKNIPKQRVFDLLWLRSLRGAQCDAQSIQRCPNFDAHAKETWKKIAASANNANGIGYTWRKDLACTNEDASAPGRPSGMSIHAKKKFPGVHKF